METIVTLDQQFVHYLSLYITLEVERGNTIDDQTILNAVEAYNGGAE